MLNFILDYCEANSAEEQEEEINDNDRTLSTRQLLPVDETVTSREFQCKSDSLLGHLKKNVFY